ncbi:MAG TPA: Maf family protein [Microvirga sp.]|jgi:septum formation protein|nr:Maf family protein [Microvirga sp.]
MTPSVWTDPAPLLLASTSPTRRALLESAGIPVEIEAPGVDERAVEAAARGEGLDPPGLALRLAAEKALAVSRRRPGRLALGADQVLDLDGRVLHKAPDREAAVAKLLALAGRRHALRAAVALARDGAVVDAFVESAVLAMRPLGRPAVERYLDAAGPDVLGSVGAYQIEGLGVHLFEAVDGDHATILGLPLLPLLARLRARGCLAL